MVEETMKISRQMKYKFPTIPLDDLIPMAFIFLSEQRIKHPHNDGALEYVNARWDLFHYCSDCIKYFKTEYTNENIINLYEKNREKDSIEYSELKTKEQIMKMDMQKNLSSDALYIIAEILSYKLLEKVEVKYRLSKKNKIVINLRKDGWDNRRSNNAIEEITIWWRKYFD